MDTTLNLLGRKFGRWLVIKKAFRNKRRCHWLCRCDCGTERIVVAYSLLGGGSKSCGCKRKEFVQRKDLTGKKFGRLTAIKFDIPNKHGHSRWLCRCSCGKTCTIEVSSLLSGHTKSCGCLLVESCSKRFSGKNSFWWKGGITPQNLKIRSSIEYRLWREAVFARDAWTCVDCGKRGERLNAHHIKSFSKFPELRLAIDNGITLCLECHGKTSNFCRKNVIKK